MINRDFTKSSKQYLNKNKFILIALGVILALGIIMLSVFGFKGGIEVKGYNTFSVKLGSIYQADELDDYTEDISENLSSQNANLQSVQITGEGGLTTLVVKYTGKLKDVESFNQTLAEDFGS